MPVVAGFLDALFQPISWDGYYRLRNKAILPGSCFQGASYHR